MGLGPGICGEQVKYDLERKKAGGGGGEEKSGELCQFLHPSLWCQTPTGPLHFPVVDHRYPTHQFRFHVWVGWQEEPRSIGAVISLGLLSEQQSERVLTEEVCVAFSDKFLFVVGSSSALKKKKSHRAGSFPLRERPFCRLVFSL